MASSNQPQGISKTWADLNKSAADAGYAVRKNTSSPDLQNFLQSIGNFVTSQPQAPTGRGAGDIAQMAYMNQLNKAYPAQAIAQATGSPAWTPPTSARQAAANRTPSPVSAAKKAAVSKASGVTPATAGIKKIVANYQAAQNQAATNPASQAAQGASPFTSTDPTYDVNSVYSPLQDLLAKQKQQASQRYADNQSNIKTIFGALTGLGASDAAAIKKQFEDSVANQQTSLSNRIAEQKAAQVAGVAQTAVTGGERGSGPALQGSPVDTAIAQGNAQAGAIQQNWAGLMGANQLQAAKDATDRGAGYGQQELGAMAQLQNNFQNTMSGFDQQGAQLQSEIAQGNLTKQQAIASNAFEQAINSTKLQNALDVAGITAKGRTDVANINQAGASSRSASSSAASAAKAAAKAKTYSKDVVGWTQQVTDLGGPTAVTQIKNSVPQAVKEATTAIKKATGKTPSKSDIAKYWDKQHPDATPMAAAMARQYITKYY
jgi:hypothetical protein